MKLKGNRNKIKKAIAQLSLSSLIFLFAPLMILIMNQKVNGFISAGKVVMATMLFLIAIFLLYLLANLISRKAKPLLEITESSLIIRSNLLKGSTIVNINEINSIDEWNNISPWNSNQIKIVLHNASDNESIANQLTGKHLYITDYLLDREDLNNFITELKNTLPNKD